MGEIRVPSEERVAEVAKELKKSPTLIVFESGEMSIPLTSYAYKHNIDELLNAIEPVLGNLLNLACGDITLLNDEERVLLDRYASWDRHNHKRRKTASELIEDNKDDTWGGNV